MTQLCVLFDMDGTLYDSEIGIQAIRNQLGLPQEGRPILDQLREQLPEIRDRGIELLHAAEAKGAANGSLISGTREMLAWLREMNIRFGLVTNNSRRSVDVILEAHPLLRLEVIVTRDDAPMKPEPDLFLLAMNKLACKASETAAVGDAHLDGIAAHSAGIREIHLVSLPEWMANVIPSDIVYKPANSLADVRSGLEAWLLREDASGSRA
jgi:HAD superfamily hydrolase (TIGR01509 family)